MDHITIALRRSWRSILAQVTTEEDHIRVRVAWQTADAIAAEMGTSRWGEPSADWYATAINKYHHMTETAIKIDYLTLQ